MTIGGNHTEDLIFPSERDKSIIVFWGAGILINHHEHSFINWGLQWTLEQAS